MGEKKESKLQHIMRTSWESEQLPGWEDTLSMIVEATKKEFRLGHKEAAKNNAGMNTFENEASVLEEDYSM